jgi:hypothetical protein
MAWSWLSGMARWSLPLAVACGASAAAVVTACEEAPPAKVPSAAELEQTDLPWPLPLPSTSMEIPRELRAPAEAGNHLTRPADWLSSALREAGYRDLNWYDIPGGFALVTGLELIDDQGLAMAHPDPALRFGAIYPPLGFFTMRFWSQLLAERTGRFRLFVFVVIDQPFGYSKDVTDPEVVWKHPAQELPLSRADLPYRPQDKWYVLVYELEHPPGTDHAKLVEHPSDPALHLTKSGVAAALEREATADGGEVVAPDGGSEQ